MFNILNILNCLVREEIDVNWAANVHIDTIGHSRGHFHLLFAAQRGGYCPFVADLEVRLGRIKLLDQHHN